MTKNLPKNEARLASHIRSVADGFWHDIAVSESAQAGLILSITAVEGVDLLARDDLD